MPPIPHYYGDIVRRLFIASGVIMVLTLPIFNHLLSINLLVSVFAILVVAVMAGMISPMQPWTALVDLFVSLIALLVFEYHAVNYYSTYGFNFLFLVTQSQALLFFVASYYSSKTLRGLLLK